LAEQALYRSLAKLIAAVALRFDPVITSAVIEASECRWRPIVQPT
jgi:hypothetical protein